MSYIELTKARESLVPTTFFTDCARNCELLNITQQDMYGDIEALPSVSWLRRFELEVSMFLNFDDAVFLPSGTMGQNIVLAASRSKSNRFVCHYSSHMLLHEKNSYFELLQMEAEIVKPVENSIVQFALKYSDVASLLDSHPTPSVLIVELPHREIGGKCTSWDDLVAMSEHCRRLGVRFHCDGARLWEAEAAYDRPLCEICALFDSVYVSFYKGLGGVTGAMLLSTRPFIAECRDWIRRFGGNLFCQLPLAVSCWAGFRENKNTFHAKKQRMVEIAERLTMLFASASPSPLVRFDPPVPVVSLAHVYIRADVQTALRASEAAAACCGIKCFVRLRPANTYGALLPALEEESYFEFNVGPLNQQVGLETWVEGWTAFLSALQSEKQKEGVEQTR